MDEIAKKYQLVRDIFDDLWQDEEERLGERIVHPGIACNLLINAFEMIERREQEK